MNGSKIKRNFNQWKLYGGLSVIKKSQITLPIRYLRFSYLLPLNLSIFFAQIFSFQLSTYHQLDIIQNLPIYPFTAPAANPSTIRLLKKKKAIKMGIILIIRVAPIAPQSVKY